ncbi:potassium transporter [Paenibacillus sp. J31TS4]|uniref:cation:proton antiporter regulatory subunit n=1 Tax=Paenibacillus sp. J31TS4 TaxID=2807195 RepID=UPI001B21BA05|nr:cation:proton antiporter regulatory subunit [Paenibacillus sp. J31TS4]GIP39399.1 potassium transporter [Paenibacillus sp. J31TS4]
MQIREIELPGVGKKFELLTKEGDKLVLVLHDDGRRECFQFQPGEPDDSVASFSLDDDEARLFAAIVGGMTYKPKALETIEVALDELVIEWYRIEPEYACVGRTIGELNVRRQTGATIIAVAGKQGTQINPGPEFVLSANSMLVVAGERRQQRDFKQVLKNGCD